MYIFSPKFPQVFWLVFPLKIPMQVNTLNAYQDSNIHSFQKTCIQKS